MNIKYSHKFVSLPHLKQRPQKLQFPYKRIKLNLTSVADSDVGKSKRHVQFPAERQNGGRLKENISTRSRDYLQNMAVQIKTEQQHANQAEVLSITSVATTSESLFYNIFHIRLRYIVPTCKNSRYTNISEFASFKRRTHQVR